MSDKEAAIILFRLHRTTATDRESAIIAKHILRVASRDAEKKAENLKQDGYELLAKFWQDEAASYQQALTHICQQFSL